MPSHGPYLWYEALRQRCDFDRLEAVLHKKPERCFAFALRLNRSKPQDFSSIQVLSLGESGFLPSSDKQGSSRFWPASTIKLLAAILACMRCEALGLSLETQFDYEDLGQSYQRSLKTLIKDALVVSCNLSYNHLMLLTGLDRANAEYIPQLGLPFACLQRRYQRHHPSDNLRQAPEFWARDRQRSVRIPAECSTLYFPAAPNDANRIALVELAELLRRLLTAPKSLPLSYDMQTYLKQCLLAAPNCIEAGVLRALHAPVSIYNKGGKVIGDDRLECAYIQNPYGAFDYILALSVAQSATAEDELAQLAQRCIETLDA